MSLAEPEPEECVLIWKMNGAVSAFDARDRSIAAAREQLRDIVKTMKGDQNIAIESDLRADAFMRHRNRDSSEVKACGCATRAVARHGDEDPDHVTTCGPAEPEESFTV